MRIWACALLFDYKRGHICKYAPRQMLAHSWSPEDRGATLSRCVIVSLFLMWHVTCACLIKCSTLSWQRLPLNVLEVRINSLKLRARSQIFAFMTAFLWVHAATKDLFLVFIMRNRLWRLALWGEVLHWREALLSKVARIDVTLNLIRSQIKLTWIIADHSLISSHCRILTFTWNPQLQTSERKGIVRFLKVFQVNKFCFFTNAARSGSKVRTNSFVEY